MAGSAFDQYGYVATLANSIPDLKKKLNEALANNWDPQKFAQEIQTTNWWRNSSDQVKQNAILKATKPGQFKAQRDQLVDKVRTMAKGMGVGLTEGKGGTLGYVVDHAMALGWDDTMLQQHIGSLFQFHRGATSAGQAGSLQQQIREIRSQYGIGSNEDIVAGQVRSILAGTQTVDGYKAQISQAAQSRYPGFKQQLAEGQTMAQIADPYIQTIASTLELSPSDVDLMDPSVQRALTNRDQHGNPVPMALWQVQDQARQDPRYDHTKQAVSDAYSMINQIGKDWGFSG